MVQGHQKWYSGLSNTQIQICKYTNTAGNTQHTYIFEKPTIHGHQKWYSGLSNAQIQRHKYTNTKTQIHKHTVMKCRKYPTCAIFSKRQGFKDIKNDILDCQKYKYTGDAITIQIWSYEPLSHWLTFALYHQVYSNWFWCWDGFQLGLWVRKSKEFKKSNSRKK